jgi:hypothetical protein
MCDRECSEFGECADYTARSSSRGHAGFPHSGGQTERQITLDSGAFRHTRRGLRQFPLVGRVLSLGFGCTSAPVALIPPRRHGGGRSVDGIVVMLEQLVV